MKIQFQFSPVTFLGKDIWLIRSVHFITSVPLSIVKSPNIICPYCWDIQNIFDLSEVLNLSIECYCQTFSVLVVATMCLAGHQDLSCSFFPIFFTFFFRIVNKPSSEVVSFIFAIALVRRTWLSATGTAEVTLLTLQARRDGPRQGVRFDKEVMLRFF